MQSNVHSIEHSFPVMTYDIDFAGVVSNITYIRWLEDLRNLYAEQFLSLGEAFQRGIAPALMRTEIDYLAPVRFPDTVRGRMWLADGRSLVDGSSTCWLPSSRARRGGRWSSAPGRRARL
jgi:acyl-CoA thioesterase FadM